MSIDDRMRIDPLRSPAPAAPTTPGAAGESEFRRLLEKLEAVAKRGEPTRVDDVDGLQDAVRRADDDFAQVMDLRRQLEEAYRKSRP